MTVKSNQSILPRFSGTAGKSRLAEYVCRQQLVAGNMGIAQLIVQYGKLAEVESGAIVIQQGMSDNDLYFIIAGAVSIIVNGREIATREAGAHFGEMALVDATVLRSASVKTTERTTLLKLSEVNFTNIANAHPELWRSIAVIVCNRLRERNKFHPPPHDKPVVFIGSSSEALDAASVINKAISRKSVTTRLWSQGVFEASKTTIEDLWALTNDADFAIIVLSPDDICLSRGKEKQIPRDNVIFELGLFIGALGRERAFIVTPSDVDIKIPTDLLGVTCLRYKSSGSNTLGRRLQTICKELLRLIIERGPR